MFEFLKVAILALAGGGWAFMVLVVYGAFKISSRLSREEEQRESENYLKGGTQDVH